VHLAVDACEPRTSPAAGPTGVAPKTGDFTGASGARLADARTVQPIDVHDYSLANTRWQK
jgi:hypothetical protein